MLLKKENNNVQTTTNKFENLRDPSVKSFISLRNINKVYPNGFQAVYDFNLDIHHNEFIVFVGPSGCGKSTTLRMIAGLEDITAGDLYISQIYSNNLSPKDRDIAMVFQNYALYPHMTVYENMAFSLKMRHVDKDEIDRRVKEAAEILDLTTLLDRKPRQLSGGQMQRVALGRTIVRKAKVFLMDEPLSNLDAKLRVTMRSEIIKLHQRLNTTSIYVTHDQTEAMTMASRIVVMNKGHVQQIGTPEEIYSNPSNKFVASFIGTPAMNIFKAEYNNGKIIFNNGYTFTLDKARKEKINEYFHNEIKKLQDRLNNLEYEVELVPHLISRDEAKELDKESETISDHLSSDERSAVKAHQLVSKAVLKGSNQFKIKNLFKKKALPTKEEVEELIKKEINDKIAQYENNLKGKFEIEFGVRPEHVALSKKTTFTNNAPVFDVNVTVAELLGNEYYIHSDYQGIDFIARIDADQKVTTGENITLTFNLDKIHIFDTVSDKTIF